MKALLLTGIAEETDFETKQTRYLLVFNRGLLRVPVSEQAAKDVIAQLGTEEHGNGIRSAPPEAAAVFEAGTRESGEVYPTDTDDNDVPQV